MYLNLNKHIPHEYEEDLEETSLNEGNEATASTTSFSTCFIILIKSLPTTSIAMMSYP